MTQIGKPEEVYEALPPKDVPLPAEEPIEVEVEEEIPA